MDPLSEHGTARRVGVVTGGIFVLVTVLSLLIGPFTTSARAADDPLIKVYVVRSAAQNGGVADTLPEIAQRTLGNSARASDIFQLNDGRKQADGGTLTSLDQTLDPGWILRLPPDASGPFVQLGRDTGAAAAGVNIPVTVAVAGGIPLLALTFLILFRRQAAAAGRRLGRSAARLTQPLRRRKSRQLRAQLAGQWRTDNGIRAAARAALTEVSRVVADSTAGPMAVDLSRDSVRVLPAPAQLPPAPWRTDGPVGWTRPPMAGFAAGYGDDGCRPVLVGGSVTSQSFVDLSYCDGALALLGDERTVAEVLWAVIGDVTTHHPDIRVALLGEPPAGTDGRYMRFRHTSELATMVTAAPSSMDAPVLAAAQRRRLTGVVAVPATVSAEEKAQTAWLCSVRGSTWVAVIAGDVPDAHWRWHAHRDGTLHVPLLNRTVVATL